MDDVSQAIGRLQASEESARNQRTELFKQNGEIKSDISEIKSLLKVHMSETQGVIKRHDAALISHADDIAVLKKFRQRVYIVVAGIGGGGGILGGVATKLASYFGLES